MTNKIFNGLANTTAAITIALLSSVAEAPVADSKPLPEDKNTYTEPEAQRQPPPLTIFFDKESDELSQSGQMQVKEIADYLKSSGDTFEIRGCSDPKGNDTNNFFLSYRRMGAVRNELEQYSIPQHQYADLYGDGEDCPSLIDGEEDTPEQARRAEFILNPVYEQPAPTDSNYTIFDLFRDMDKDDPSP